MEIKNILFQWVYTGNYDYNLSMGVHRIDKKEVEK